MVRNIRNLNLANGRNIRNLPSTVSILGTEPVEVVESDSNTKITVSLKGLSGFSADKIIKVNSAGDALEYATETDTVYTLQSPLSFISANKIQLQQTLFNISTSLAEGDYIPIFDVDGNFDRITFANLKAQIPDTNTEYTLQSPLSFISANKIQLDQSLFNIQTILNNGDYFPYFDTAGNFDRITFSNLKAQIPNTTYTGASPIVLSGTEFQIDFSGLLDYGGETITNATEFLVSTDGIKTMRALTYSKLKTDLEQTLFQYDTETSINDADLVLFFDETGIVSNKYKNITFANFKTQITTTALDFGTIGSDVSTRFIGKETAPLTINASNFNLLANNTFLRAIFLNNLNLQDQWNNLLTFRRAMSSTDIAFSQAIYEHTSGGTSVNRYWGLFSDTSAGTDSGSNPIIEVRSDGQVVFRSNMTVANPMTNLPTLVPQLQFQPLISGSTYLSKYMPYIRFGLAHSTKVEAFIRWTYSTGGLNYVGFNYGTETTSTDIMSLASNGNMAIAGSYGSSDKRIKKDIVDADLDECITVMKSIKLKKYKYTDAYQETYSTTKENVYGFLADDILENEYLNYCGEISQMPKNLSNGEVLNDFKTIEKSKILTVLWGCCNKQQEEIELLKSEIANIKSVLNL